MLDLTRPVHPFVGLIQEAALHIWNEQVRSDGRERPFEEFCAFAINRGQELEDSI